MNINLTILGQSIAFIFFVWFCLKFIWPPVIGALRDRQRQIAEGLAASDRAREALAKASADAEQAGQAAKVQAQEIIDLANRRADQIIEQAKQQAEKEGAGLIAAAQADIALEVSRAREDLREQVVALAVQGAEKIVQADVDARQHSAMLKDLAARL